MNFLVTGGAGFIGSHLCTFLLEEKSNHVIAIDNFTLGKKDNVSHLLNFNNFELIEGDVNNFIFLETIFSNFKFDRVYHLAANSDISISHKNPSVDYKNTFQTTWSILEMIRIYQIQQFVFASTSAIFGEAHESIDENYGPIQPISHYGAGKLASEAFISSFSYNYNIETLIVRFPNVVGGRSTHGIIYDFLKKLSSNPDELIVLGNGKQEKSYLHVSDLIKAIQQAWSVRKNKFEVFNIGGIDSITVQRIAEIVLEETKGKQKIRYTGGDRGWIGDVPKFNYEIKKILNTGWLPSLNSEQSIRRTVIELLNEQLKFKHDN